MMQLDTVILKLRVPIDGRQRRRVSSILPCLVVAFALARPLHAQTCSGGVDGGMDATGSLCNLPVATMTVSAEATAHVVQGREGAAWEASEPRLRLIPRPLSLCADKVFQMWDVLHRSQHPLDRQQIRPI